MFSIDRLYDSHLHLVSTGEQASMLDLSQLKSLDDIAQLKIESHHYRGEWLYAFGWDQNNWGNKTLPTRRDLDKFFPDCPVFFVRVDGHASWLNTKALERVGCLTHDFQNLSGGQINRDEKGFATGILTENAHMKIYEFLPKRSQEQIKQYVLAACSVLNQNGFTHVRDMACHAQLWKILLELEQENKLTLFIEENFSCENKNDFARALAEAIEAKKQETRLLKVKGIKLYFDGSLGSDTAYLSVPYAHRADQYKGILCWPTDDVEYVIRKTWQNGLEISIHTIGDEAAHLVVQIARKISAEGIGGKLNLEHTEVLRNETIQMMKPLHVTCHIQPCHWLSDRKWLKEKTGDLYQYVFPWGALEAAKIPFYFGSDTPIERPSFFQNELAISESKKHKIRALTQPISKYHTCPDSSVMSKTTIADGKIVEVIFDGKVLFKS